MVGWIGTVIVEASSRSPSRSEEYNSKKLQTTVRRAHPRLQAVATALEIASVANVRMNEVCALQSCQTSPCSW